MEPTNRSAEHSSVVSRGRVKSPTWHPWWLAISALGIFVVYRALQDVLARCDGCDWGFFFDFYFPEVGLSELGGPLVIGAALVIAGIAGSLGFLAGPSRLAGLATGWLAHVWSGSAKIKWAVSIAALWGLPFLYGLYVFAKPPTGAVDPIGSAALVGGFLIVGSLIAFVATALVVWLVLFIASLVISRVGGRSGEPSS